MATRSSIFYRIIRAGIGVLCLLGLTSLRVQSLDTTTPPLPVLFVLNERQHFATLYDTILHYFVWKCATARGHLTLRLLNALNSEDMGFEGAFFPCDDSIWQRISSNVSNAIVARENAPSNPYPHYLVRLATSRNFMVHGKWLKSWLFPRDRSFLESFLSHFPWTPKSHLPWRP